MPSGRHEGSAAGWTLRPYNPQNSAQAADTSALHQLPVTTGSKTTTNTKPKAPPKSAQHFQAAIFSRVRFRRGLAHSTMRWGSAPQSVPVTTASACTHRRGADPGTETVPVLQQRSSLILPDFDLLIVTFIWVPVVEQGWQKSGGDASGGATLLNAAATLSGP